jgi:hypothetical protein
VLIDTNILFTRGATAPFRRDLDALIQATPNGAVSITWCVPEVVASERAFQMFSHAKTKAAALREVEEILERELLNPAEMSLEFFAKRVAKHLADLGVMQLRIDPSKVDWARMIRRAVFREAPFSPGENERGFRDAVILEVARQAVDALLPGELLVFAVADGLLAETASNELVSSTRCTVVRSLETLRECVGVPRDAAEIATPADVARFEALIQLSTKEIIAGNAAAAEIARIIEAIGREADHTLAELSRLLETRSGADLHALVSAEVLRLNAANASFAAALDGLVPRYSAHFRAAIESVARAAACPIEFLEEEQAELRSQIDGFVAMLDAFDSSRQSLQALLLSVRQASEAGAPAGATAEPLASSVERLIARHEDLHMIGRRAATALRRFLKDLPAE